MASVSNRATRIAPLWVFLCMLFLSVGPAYAGVQVLYVNGQAAPGGSGQSWETAFRNLQDALNAANGPAAFQIWVAKGVYRPDEGVQFSNGDRNAAFLLQTNTELLGGFFGNETSVEQRNPSLNETILTGDLLLNDESGLTGDNAFHVVISSGVENTIIDGFTIRGGRANVEKGVSASGAGMFIQSSQPVVRQCRFIGNSALLDGGAVFVQSGAVELVDCEFSLNEAGENGGAVVVSANSVAIIVRSTFVNNSATRGGAVYMLTGAGFIAAVNSEFFGNSASFGGGAFYLTGSSLVITTVVAMSGNMSPLGAAFFVDGEGEVIATNCTLAQNVASSGGGGIYMSTTGDVVVRNSILWENEDAGGMDQSAQINIQSGQALVDFCRVQGWTGNLVGQGNSGADPLLKYIPGPDGLVGTDDDNLRIRPGSSAIDAGSNNFIPLDGGDVDNDGVTQENHPLDLDGRSRRIDDPLTQDTGVGAVPITDIGAYEFFNDCNGNGIPDANELENETANDCDGNLILDECDIRDCAGSASCDDCNMNGLLDSCDLESGAVVDDNRDGRPDSCVEWMGGRDSSWNQPENWAGGEVPNNFDSDTFNVTIRGATQKVTVDVPVQIDSLRILEGAEINVTSSCDCDLQITTAGGLLNEGTIHVAGSRNVLVPQGPFVIGDGGVYQKSPDCTSLCTSELFADRVEMLTTYCGATDQITLVDEMRLTTVNEFLMDGRGATGCGAIAGGETPPILKVVPDSVVVVGQGVRLRGRTSIGTDRNASTSSAGPGGGATIVFDLTGDYVNESTDPIPYQLQSGGVLVRQDSTFEAASRDVGPSESGFGTMEDPNFSLGGLQIDPGVRVTFENQFANVISSDPCREAMYIDALDLAEGSTIVLDNVNVYYRDLMLAPGAEVIEVGCGRLSDVCDFNATRIEGNNSLGVCDDAPFMGEVAAFQRCYSDADEGILSSCCSLFDYDSDGDVDNEDYVGLLARVDKNPNCCVATDDCGCGDEKIEVCVCAVDPFCCETAWDLTCADLASGCQGGNCTHGCCEEGPAGCDAPGVESCVCGMDPFCCNSAWDYLCIQIANEVCGGCGS
ncbi:MAG: right-handed parallel beta-helix repeat-containing protein [Phycisphaerae bacterium]